MNNTALRAEMQASQVENTPTTHMIFANKEQKQFYYEKLKRVRVQDCYHKALIYILGIAENTRTHFDQIYDCKTGYIKIECLQEGWQTSSSAKAVRLAFNLYTDKTSSVNAYKRKDKQIAECREYSISQIFCCEYARYFWEGIRLRYAEYCH